MPMQGKDLTLIIATSIITIVMLWGYVAINVSYMQSASGQKEAAAKAAKAVTQTEASQDQAHEDADHSAEAEGHEAPAYESDSDAIPSVGPDAAQSAPPPKEDTSVRGH